MKNGVKIFLCLGGMLVFAPIGWANVSNGPNVPSASVERIAPAQSNAAALAPADEQEPYSAIWVRNAFDLSPKPDPAAGKDAEKNLPPANIKLVGIYTFSGKHALVSVQQSNGPGKGQKEDYYNMTEGERRGGLEVLEINPGGRTIKIKNDEIVSTLTFETNNPASRGAMAGAPRPPASGFGGYRPGMPPGPETRMPMALPSRMTRGGFSSAMTPQNNAQPAGYASGYNYNTSGTSGTSYPNSYGSGQSTPNAAEQATTPEETAAILRLQQLAAEQSGRSFPPLPPGFGGGSPDEGNGGSSAPSTPGGVPSRPRPTFTPPPPP